MTSQPETCPLCGHQESDVIATRRRVLSKHRIRRCTKPDCRHKWSTWESIVDPEELPTSTLSKFRTDHYS